MANLQVEQIGAKSQIQGRVSNPFGTENIEFLNDYQQRNTVNGEVAEEVQYKNLQKAEANYFTAGLSLGSCTALKQFNMIAKMQGYDKVNTIHRHDVN